VTDSELNLTREDIENISRKLTQVLIEHIPQQENTVETTILHVYTIVPQELITQTINLDMLASSEFGITDILGQISGFFQSIGNWIISGVTAFVSRIKDALIGFISDMTNKILWGIADFTARVITKLVEYMGPKFIELGYAIADVITKISAAIASGIVTISTAVSTSINMVATSLAAGIAAVGTSISMTINQVATALSAGIAMVGTALSTQILSLGQTLSQSILSIGTSLSAAIASVGTAISQSILSVATSLSISINHVATAISGAIASVATAISGAIVQLATSFAVGLNQVATALSTAIVNVATGISTAIAAVGTSISMTINQVATALSGAIVQLSTAISAAITQIGTSIINVIGGMLTTIIANMYLLVGKVDVAVTIMQEYFPRFTEALSSNLVKISMAIGESASTILSVLVEVSTRINETIVTNFTVFIDAFIKSMDKVVNFILDVSDKTTKILVDNMVRTIEAIARTGEMLASALANIHKTITDSIIASFENTSRAIRESYEKFMDTLRTQFEKLSDVLRDQYRKTVDATLETGNKTIDFIKESSDKITATLIKNFQEFMGTLLDAMKEVQKDLEGLAKSWQGFVNAVLQLPDRLEPTLKEQMKELWRVLFEDKLPGWKVVWDKVPEFFQSKSISGFDALTLSLKASVTARPYASVTIGDVTKYYVAAKEIALGKVEKELPAWLSSPSFLFEPLISAFVRFIEPAISDLWEKIKSAFETLTNAIVNALKAFAEKVFETFKNILSGIAKTLIDSITGLYNLLEEAAKSLGTFYETEHKKVVDQMGVVVKDVVVSQVSGLLKEFGISSPEFLKIEKVEETLVKWSTSSLALITMPFWAQLPVRMLRKALHALGSYLYGQSLPISAALKPFGIGISIKFDIAKALGAGISHFSRELKYFLDRVFSAYAYGVGIWSSQPMSKMLNYFLRNIIPIEIPTIDQMTEIVRRAMSLIADKREKDFEELLKLAKLYTAVQGFPDTILNLLYWKEDEYSVTIIDRFQKERKIPLSTMYVLPSPSDVARMVIRDIILEPEAIRKIFAARGMNKDIADMYYLLHFRYPPPERLWTFYTRGISGLLWARLSPAEADIVKKEAQNIGAFAPVSPAELNFAYAALDNLLKTYMKWQDYARFSYNQGWPSDNLIVIDTLADIPTKIDQRWMVRFGLYELLSEKGVKHTSEVKDFISKVVEGAAKGKITLDLTNFCRTLQATGLHPYYVPITAVAETINAITDERTLLRTGVMNLFKEGFFNASSVMKMLTGVLTVSFNVAYFNPETGQWSTGVINVPLRYLEMEARLIGLRAIMDRALDILRDIQRDVLTGYQEFIIETYDEFKNRFTQVINNINKVYASDYKAITGESPPDELTIRFIEEYYKPYTDALNIWRDIWTVRRIRMWTQRWLGWLMYRIGYGVTKKKEIEELVDYMVKTCKLPQLEREYISRVMEYMMKLSLREYIPTPSQLATIAEYIKISDDTIMKAFEQRGVPEEWTSFWKKYIEVRPLADDIRGLLSSYRRLLIYAKKVGKIPSDIEGVVKSLMSEIGFTDKEMAIFDLRVTIEEMLAQLKEYVPTPMQMATLSEFIELPDALVDAAFEIRGVPPEWRTIWKNYIDIRPLADDVRELIRAYLRAIEYTEEAKGMLGVVMGYAQKIGFGADEINILQTRVRLEEMIYNTREYIPTPSQLATIVEVLPHAREYFDDVMNKRRVPANWQKLWAEYIDIKPLIDDLKKFLTGSEQLYIKFMIKKDDFIKMITDVLNKLGYTKDEQDLLLKITELERWRNAWTELIGSVERLVSLSEYSPRASKYALGKMYEMIDSLPISQADKQELKAMWEEYIRNRPVKSEARTYITQLSNLYAEGLISDADFSKELEAMKQWGFSDDEIMFYKARAALMKARKMKIPIGG
jgi:phage-related protein